MEEIETEIPIIYKETRVGYTMALPGNDYATSSFYLVLVLSLSIGWESAQIELLQNNYQNCKKERETVVTSASLSTLSHLGYCHPSANIVIFCKYLQNLSYKDL